MPSTTPNGPSPDHDRLRDLFHRAIALPPAEREAFVRRETTEDPQLAERALRLLAHADAPSERLLAKVSAAMPSAEPDEDDPTLLDDDPVQPTPTDELLHKLAQSPRLDARRFAFEKRIGEGGMGEVHRVQDQHLNRRLAVKLVLPKHKSDHPVDRSAAAEVLGRFLEEAQVTSQLDHPGVIPVHELGLDQHGDVFFMMRQVKGRTADKVFADAHAGRNDWSLTRALEVVLKVCDTMSYAHARGVLHRDLKPRNVMVGRFGEVYVLDWGLAKVRGQADRHDERLQADAAGSVPFAEPEGSGLASTGRTRQGSVLGTPNYMPPEQARGDFRSLDERTDVYAIGAMLYELLTGAPPYAAGASSAGDRTVRERVIAGPPPSVESLQPGVPAELVAIVGKAMARDREQRYPSTAALAADVRAFLGSQVVSAYRTGALVELQLWVKRNKPLAASLVAAVLILVAGIVVSWRLANEKDALAREKTALAEEKTALAKSESEARKEATERAASEGRLKAEAQRTVGNFNQLSAVVRLEDAIAKQDTLWPAWPDKIAALQEWLDKDCAELLKQRPQIEATIAELRSKALPLTAEQVEANRQVAPDAAKPERRTWTFGDDEEGRSAEFLHNALVDVLAGLNSMESKQRADVVQRLQWAQQVEEASITRHRELWEKAREAIRRADGVTASALYRDAKIDLRPQMGLVPIGRNPVTLLWEFYDLRSAWDGKQAAMEIVIPTHKEDGSIDVKADTGIVLVLLPGGVMTLGSQKSDPKAPLYDPHSRTGEDLHSVSLSPFLLARHELTQGQWSRLWTWDSELRNPSQYRAGSDVVGTLISPIHPVEQVDWPMCDRLLTRHGFALPTEAQWEYGCRGGTTTPWNVDLTELKYFANLASQDAKTHGVWLMESWSDGHCVHAPVGTFAANNFGLYDVHGNVIERCQDFMDVYGSERIGDGLRPTRTDDNRVVRGGSFDTFAIGARSAIRNSNAGSIRSSILGLRAMRFITY